MLLMLTFLLVMKERSVSEVKMNEALYWEIISMCSLMGLVSVLEFNLQLFCQIGWMSILLALKCFKQA